MKKIIALMTVLGLMLSFAAMAETVTDPFAEREEIVDPFVEEEPTADEEPAVEPQGRMVYQYEETTAANQVRYTVREVNFTDVAQAREAADDSVKLRAPNGSQMLQAQIVVSPFNERIGRELLLEDALRCTLIVNGKVNENGRVMLESSVNTCHPNNAYHTDPTCVERNPSNYLVNVANSGMYLDSSYVSTEYYMYDYIVDVSTSDIESGAPIYIQIQAGEEQYYYQVQ